MEKIPAPSTRKPVDEPKGDLGQGHKPWRPAEGEQGISNRPDDEAEAMPDGDESSDAGAFNPSSEEEDND